MANFVANSVVYFAYFDSPFKVESRKVLVEGLKASLGGGFDEPTAKQDDTIRLRSGDNDTYLWIDETSLMVITWFSVNGAENKKKLLATNDYVTSFIRHELTPKKYNKIVVKAPGYYFPDSADTEEASRSRVTALMQKIVGPRKIENVLDYSIDTSHKYAGGKKSANYTAVRNSETGIYALSVEAMRQIDLNNEDSNSTAVNEYISGTNILEDLAEERHVIEQFEKQ
jgi:hypothetical protein